MDKFLVIQPQIRTYQPQVSDPEPNRSLLLVLIQVLHNYRHSWWRATSHSLRWNSECATLQTRLLLVVSHKLLTSSWCHCLRYYFYFHCWYNCHVDSLLSQRLSDWAWASAFCELLPHSMRFSGTIHARLIMLQLLTKRKLVALLHCLRALWEDCWMHQCRSSLSLVSWLQLLSFSREPPSRSLLLELPLFFGRNFSVPRSCMRSPLVSLLFHQEGHRGLNRNLQRLSSSPVWIQR